MAVLMCLLLFPVPNPLSPEAKKKLEKLQGNWSTETLVKNGREMQFKPDRTPMTLRVKGREWLVEDKLRYEIASIDVKANPMQINLKIPAANGQPAKTQEAIFSVSADGQKLTLALPLGEDAKRPTEFNAPEESDRLLFVLKRVKEK